MGQHLHHALEQIAVHRPAEVLQHDLLGEQMDQIAQPANLRGRGRGIVAVAGVVLPHPVAQA